MVSRKVVRRQGAFCYEFSHRHSILIDIICNSPEFKEERKVLLEVIGPELQSIYDDKQIEVGEVE